MPSRAASAALVAALLLAPAAWAQTLYKWTDAEGRTHYGDKPPKGFKGVVTSLEPDPPPLAQPAPAAPPKAAAPKAEAPPAQDLNAKRRATREQLEARLAAARQNLEAARKARAEGEEAELDERQAVQRLRATDITGKGTPRATCREVPGKNPKPDIVCTQMVPGEAYYGRIERLDEAVRQAEEELAVAQRAYRRGLD